MTPSVLDRELCSKVVDPATGTRPDGIVAEPSQTLLDVFAETVQRHGERSAIEAPDRELTYGQLLDAAIGLAGRLSAIGVGPGDRVGVRVASGTADLYVAILGVLHAGAAYVPVDADDPAKRTHAIWESARACAVIEDGLRITELATPLGAGSELGVGDDAWVIFTSGSTGVPKGVAVSHRAAAAFVDAETRLWTVRPDDRVLAGLSVGFDASCEEMWLAWRNGAALVPAPRALVRAAADLGPWLAAHGVSVISTVPTLAEMWDEADLAGVRLLIFGGEACPEALAWRLSADREVWNTYGPTEATVVTTAAPLRPGEAVTIGWPLCGWEIAVVGDDGEPVALGEPGELVIGGVGLARYIDEDLDAKRYGALPARGWPRAYRTGDMVRETPAGLAFIGRRDHQVKLGGRRLELGEIEGQLRAVAGVRAAVAVVQRTAAGNPVLVGYVVGEVDPAVVRSALSEQLPAGIVPLVISLRELPMSSAGKVDRKALPWPPPADAERFGGSELTGTAAWLAERWVDQLGPLPISEHSDFFDLGGSSLAAAKLVSVLRQRFPSVAVADVYNHRRLADLAARLDGLDASARPSPPPPADGGGRWSAVQLAGVFAMLALSTPQWVLGILTADRLTGAHLGAAVGWGWIVAGWLVFGSSVGRAAIVVAARRLLLPDLKPGRYPRRGWLTCRVWFLERLAEAFRSESLAGTPFADRYARLCGHPIGVGARLGTLPPVTSLVRVGEGATLESDVDLHGWWLEGGELVVGEISIGAGARVGTRSLLAPGAQIGEGAEIEPGSYVIGSVPAGERWAGSPATRIGDAGDEWPWIAAESPRRPRFWRAMFVGGLAFQSSLPLIVALPEMILLALAGAGRTGHAAMLDLLMLSPAIVLVFLLTYALVVAGLVRVVGSLARPGWHPEVGATGWALWFSESLMAGARTVLRPLYLSVYTRQWLRLAGIRIGKGAEVSTVVGLNRLSSFAAGSFATDDVVFAGARARNGWLHVAPIKVGAGTFLGNSCILPAGTKLGANGLIGVLTTAPRETADGTPGSARRRSSCHGCQTKLTRCGRRCRPAGSSRRVRSWRRSGSCSRRPSRSCSGCWCSMRSSLWRPPTA